MLTVPESTGYKFLYPLLAQRLASYLHVSTDDLPEGAELNEVACRYLSKGKPAQQIYSALKAVAAEAESLPIPEPVLQLAAIPFQLFISASFDSALARALNQKRFGGKAKTRVLANAPNEVQDLPGDWNSTETPIVYQLMGKLSATPAYAVTQEDVIEFFHSLQSETHRPAQLFSELSNRNLLVLGTRLSGWLTSFLMRMSKRQRLSANDSTDYVADDTVTNDKNLVLFLERFSRGTEIYRDTDPIAFVGELFRRWVEVHPEAAQTIVSPAVVAVPRQVQPGCVFLSYASENRTAVQKIKDALEQNKVDVFFDRDQLQAGNNWDAKLRRNINECGLFVPLISKETLTDDDRYFRIEWRAALARTQAMSFDPEHAFLLPVLIDDTPLKHPALPPEFAVPQATSLPGGDPTPGFVQRVVQLYRRRQLARAGAV